jgi:hypothetical protein
MESKEEQKQKQQRQQGNEGTKNDKKKLLFTLDELIGLVLQDITPTLRASNDLAAQFKDVLYPLQDGTPGEFDFLFFLNFFIIFFFFLLLTSDFWFFIFLCQKIFTATWSSWVMHMAGSPIFLQQKITYESRMERYRVDMRTFITRLEMTIQKDLDAELNIHMTAMRNRAKEEANGRSTRSLRHQETERRRREESLRTMRNIHTIQGIRSTLEELVCMHTGTPWSDVIPKSMVRFFFCFPFSFLLSLYFSDFFSSSALFIFFKLNKRRTTCTSGPWTSTRLAKECTIASSED